MTDFGGKTSIFSHPVYLFLREFSLQDFRGGSTFAQLLNQNDQMPHTAPQPIQFPDNQSVTCR
ncbi:hypothetical protein BER18_29275 [Escherichia coli]|nr:hypothetical protein BER18_29275 [Escherichia coli]PDV53312.1 hypothetical protein BER12_26220 [Escherichia coli]